VRGGSENPAESTRRFAVPELQTLWFGLKMKFPE